MGSAGHVEIFRRSRKTAYFKEGSHASCLTRIALGHDRAATGAPFLNKNFVREALGTEIDSSVNLRQPEGRRAI